MSDMRDKTLGVGVPGSIFLSHTTNRIHCPDCGGFRWEVLPFKKGPLVCTLCGYTYEGIEIVFRPGGLSEEVHAGLHEAVAQEKAPGEAGGC